jgi:hypothetical protein
LSRTKHCEHCIFRQSTLPRFQNRAIRIQPHRTSGEECALVEGPIGPRINDDDRHTRALKRLEV